MQNTALNNCPKTHEAGLQCAHSAKNVENYIEGKNSAAMPRYEQTKAGRIAAIAEALTANLDGLRYGQVSVTLRVHDGRVVDITQSVTQNTKGAKYE